MSQKVIKGTPKLSEAIRNRRQELGLTIEEAASRAGVGTKTWCRYEAGESIRRDKAKGICKALNWLVFPDEDKKEDSLFDMDEFKNHPVWSEMLSGDYGEAAAISFIIGSDILLDYLEEDIQELSVLPRGTHVGEIDISLLKEILPEQFLMRYDYEFLYCLKANVVRLRELAANNMLCTVNTVMQELALYLMMEVAELLMESMYPDMEDYGVEDLDMWKDWIFDMFGDMDIVDCLYAGQCLTSENIYHFDHWEEEQFYS